MANLIRDMRPHLLAGKHIAKGGNTFSNFEKAASDFKDDVASIPFQWPHPLSFGYLSIALSAMQEAQGGAMSSFTIAAAEMLNGLVSIVGDIVAPTSKPKASNTDFANLHADRISDFVRGHPHLGSINMVIFFKSVCSRI